MNSITLSTSDLTSGLGTTNYYRQSQNTYSRYTLLYLEYVF